MEEDSTSKSSAESASVNLAYRYSLIVCRFERELEALRKELAEAQSKSQRSSPIMDPSETDSEPVSPILEGKLLGGEDGAQLEVSTHVNGGLSLTLEGNKKDR